jgi:hypothetical protein
MNQRYLFHAFTLKYNGISNKIVSDITISQPFDPKQEPNPSLEFHNLKALWDTGATNSVIKKAVVTKLSLLPIGITNLTDANRTVQRFTYIINMILPNRVLFSGVRVVECDDIVSNFDVIIGMDIINRGDFSITNVDGKTCMSYRIPSIETIDYVRLANQITYTNVGRNDPCPCGKKDSSGKPIKFKHCCGKNVS